MKDISTFVRGFWRVLRSKEYRSLRCSHIERTACDTSSLEACIRSKPLRSCPFDENKHVYNEPLAESRAREQPPQNGLETDSMNPNRCPLCETKRRATSPGPLGFYGWSGPSMLSTMDLSSAPETTSSRFHPLVFPTSMYSMKRSGTSRWVHACANLRT